MNLALSTGWGQNVGVSEGKLIQIQPVPSVSYTSYVTTEPSKKVNWSKLSIFLLLFVFYSVGIQTQILHILGLHYTTSLMPCNCLLFKIQVGPSSCSHSQISVKSILRWHQSSQCPPWENWWSFVSGLVFVHLFILGPHPAALRGFSGCCQDPLQCLKDHSRVGESNEGWCNARPRL